MAAKEVATHGMEDHEKFDYEEEDDDDYEDMSDDVRSLCLWFYLSWLIHIIACIFACFGLCVLFLVSNRVIFCS